MLSTARVRFVALNTAVVLLWCGTAAAVPYLQSIIVSDDTAPNSVFDHGQYGPIRSDAAITTRARGSLLKDFSLNSDGQVVFTTQRASNSDEAAVWLWENGSVSLLTSTQAQSPWGVPFQRFRNSSIGGVELNSNGEVIIAGTLDEANGRRVIESLNQGIQIAEGDTAPGIEADTVFTPGPTYTAHGESPTPFNDLVLNDLGEVTYSALLNGPSVGIGNDESLWSTRGGNLSLVAREGQSLPSFGPNAVIGVSQDVPPGWIGPDPPFAAFPGEDSPISTLNNQGQIWFTVPVLDGTVTSATMRSSSPSTTPEPLIYDGVHATDSEEFTTSATFSEFSLNEAGVFVFQAGFRRANSDPSRAIWVNDGSDFHLIAEIGQVAPGVIDDSRFLFFDSYNVAPNAHGEFAFGAALGDASGHLANNRDGIWFKGDTDVELVVRAGQPAPGFAADVFRFIDDGPLPINDAGQVLFMASIGLSGDPVSALVNSIWMADATGNLRLIVREGSEIEVHPGDFRTVSELDSLSPYHMNQSHFAFWRGLLTVQTACFSYGLCRSPVPLSYWLLQLCA